MNDVAFVGFSHIFLLGILIFKGLPARRLFKSLGVKGLTFLTIPLPVSIYMEYECRINHVRHDFHHDTMSGVTSTEDQAGSLTLEDETYRLFRNLGNLPINAGSHSRTPKTSFMPLRRSVIIHCKPYHS
jgi:hypothetical protein